MKTGTKPNATGYRGVYVDPRFRDRPYRVRIMVDGRRTRAGGYETPEQAGRAYDSVAFAVWGREAILNFPRPAW